MKRAVIFIVLTLSLTVSAAIPQQMNYQGFLTSTTGAALDTTVSVRFRLYSDSLGSLQLWSELWPAVPVVDGLFNLRMGAINPLTDTPLLDAAQLWLGVSIGSNSQMTPLVRVAAVPLSLRTRTVNAALGGTITSDLIVEGYGMFGSGNDIDDSTSFVAGQSNIVAGRHSAIVSGRANSANDSLSFIGSGQSNTTYARNSVIGGGGNNRARGNFSVIGGGGGATAADSNSVSGGNSTISGGARNFINNNNATIGGGFGNSVTGIDGTVSGGALNSASGVGGIVSGGLFNHARGDLSVVSGGGGLLPVDSNLAGGSFSVVSGGRRNIAGEFSADSGAVAAGGYGNLVGAALSAISGGSNNSVQGGYSVVAGGNGNDVWNHHATIGGGESNSNYGAYSTISGGFNNLLSDSASFSVIGGGQSNSSGDDHTVIGGGELNSIDLVAHHSTIGGGFENIIDGLFSTIPGGSNNTCAGDFSFAAGLDANANHNGCFVWADATAPAGGLVSSASNQFSTRASGGYRLFSNSLQTAGVTLAAGASAWGVVSDSARKENFREVNTRDVLAKIAQLKISEWNYKAQDDQIRHIGPMAQDFYSQFGLGESDTTISTIDPDGVLFAAVQELTKRNENLETEVAELKALVRQLVQYGLQDEKHGDK